MNHNIPFKQLNKIFFITLGTRGKFLIESLGILHNSSLQVILLCWYTVVFMFELERFLCCLWHWLVELPAFHCIWTEPTLGAFLAYFCKQLVLSPLVEIFTCRDRQPDRANGYCGRLSYIVLFFSSSPLNKSFNPILCLRYSRSGGVSQQIGLHPLS